MSATSTGASTSARGSGVAVAIVTWNAARDLAANLEHVRAQTVAPEEVVVVDNASSDGTAAIAAAAGVRVVAMGENAGYAAGANRAWRETRAAWLLMVNQDAFLGPDFIERALAAAERAEHASPPAWRAGARVGAVQGLVLRTTPAERSAPAARTIDAIGIEVRRSRRNLILGHGAPEAAARAGEVFGPDGAVALFRRAALDEAAVAGAPFDADFFFGREEVDFAWRAQRLGWRTVVAPAARAFHCRTLTRETARSVPLALRRASVRARYLMLLKNERLADLARDLPWLLAFEAAYLGYMLLRDPRALLGGLLDALRLAPRALRARGEFFAKEPRHLAAPRRFLGAREPLEMPVAPSDAR